MNKKLSGLSDISFSIDWYLHLAQVATPQEFKLLMSMLARSAIQQVLTYDMPTDAGVKNDKVYLARLTGLTKAELTKALELVPHFFDLKDEKWWPKRSFYVIGQFGNLRPPVPASLRSAVLRRDNFKCMYCGGTEGPFDVDHVVPVAKGGVIDDIDNLITACVPCNRSKGAKHLEDWLE